MNTTTPPPLPSQYYNLNDLDRVSQRLNSLQSRLIMILELFKCVDNLLNLNADYRFQIEMNPTNLEIRVASNPNIILPESLKKSLSPIHCNDSEDLEHFLAVVSFNLIFGSNPYLGSGFYDKVVLNKEWEIKYFGDSREFIFSGNPDNAPDEHYQARTIDLWNHTNYTRLKDVMFEYFTYNTQAIKDLPRVVYTLLSVLTTGNQDLKIALNLSDYNLTYLLSDGKRWYDPNYILLGTVKQKSENGREDLYVENQSEYIWNLTTKSGKTKEIKPGEEIPIRSGMILNTDQYNWSVSEYKI